MKALTLLPLVVLLFACRSEPVSLSGETMGTTWEVTLAKTPASNLESTIEARLTELNSIFSHWAQDSEVSAFNQTGEAILSEPLREVITIALDLSEKTGGAFNITLGSVVSELGFGPTHLVEKNTTSPIPKAAHQRLLLEQNHLRATEPGVSIDLSAIAKGYAVDRIAEVLESEGIENYLIEIGGEIRGLGQREQGQPWKIGIQRPQPGPASIERTLELPSEGLAVATSGNYQLFRTDPEDQKKLLSHLVTVENTETTFRSVTVLHSSAMIADAWATALFAIGPEEAEKLSKLHRIEAIFLPQL